MPASISMPKVAVIGIVFLGSACIYVSVAVAVAAAVAVTVVVCDSDTVYLMNNASVRMCIDTRMYTRMFICTHSRRQVNGGENTTNSFSRAQSVEPCPWDQTNVVHAKRALRPPSVENSDNESSEGESDQR